MVVTLDVFRSLDVGSFVSMLICQANESFSLCNAFIAYFDRHIVEI